ncbi:hypothetical protein [Streptomyces zaomyceticus]|uniref:hypothetical protein n=1 Tax=Streptomyces zaomyceticus TaxID=68286 RepID=UPI00369D77A0
MIEQQWNGVRRRVAELGTRPSSDQVFGSHGHRWALEDPLSDDGLAELEDFDDATEAWDERRGALMFAPERTAGAIVISHLGCAQREWLIISGAHRGTVWSDCRVDDTDLAPLLDDTGTPVTFARWYLDWLEKAELTAHQPRTKA